MDKIKAIINMANQFDEKLIIKGNYYRMSVKNFKDDEVIIFDERGKEVLLNSRYFDMEDIYVRKISN